MDRERLVQAALLGEVDVLREAATTCKKTHNKDYECCFLFQHQPERRDKQQVAGNILHLAASNGEDKFIQEAFKILPMSLIHSLIIQRTQKKQKNPLHVAAEKDQPGVVNTIMGFCKNQQGKDFNPEPWVDKDKSKMTPLHAALSLGRDECGLEMLSMLVDGIELEKLCNILDGKDNSPLDLAIKKGCNQVAQHILSSAPSSIPSPNIAEFITNCSGEVVRLLFEKHPSYIKEIKQPVINKWTAKGKLWVLEYLLKKLKDEEDQKRDDLVKEIFRKNTFCNNVFHTAIMRSKYSAAKTLSNIYREEIIEKSTLQNDDYNVAWLVPNNKKRTPMELVMEKYCEEKIYDEYCELSNEVEMEDAKSGNIELLFHAIQRNKYLAAEGIWHIRQEFGWSLYPRGWKKMWDESFKISEEVALWVTETLLSPPAPHANEIIQYTLPLVSDSGFTKVVQLILKKNSNALNLAPKAWVTPCVKGHFSTIMAFVNSDDFKNNCGQVNDTPLHHVVFQELEHYVNMLENPVISSLKNLQDENGQTPLHKAIRDDNLNLAKALLSTNGVFRNIRNNENKTAMELLADRFKQGEWKKMCEELKIVPGLKMTYINSKINQFEIRNTLSVVAALVATITFTAGFTLPGGVKNDSTGKATLGNKGAFVAFLLADAIAMCSSIMVLVCLIWSMICGYHKALILIDKSVVLLIISLCSTLLTFMTGVYVAIPHKSLWVAIFVLVICSILIILSEGRIMDMLGSKLYPKLYERHKDEETGEPGSSQGENSKI